MSEACLHGAYVLLEEIENKYANPTGVLNEQKKVSQEQSGHKELAVAVNPHFGTGCVGLCRYRGSSFFYSKNE